MINISNDTNIFENMKQVLEYTNYYVTEKGDICNKHARILKPYIDGGGFQSVKLYKDDQGKTCRVHLLVSQSYVLNPYGYSRVIHIDEDKTNNVPSNLQWVKSHNKLQCTTEMKLKSEISRKIISDFGEYRVTREGKVYNKHGRLMSTFYEKRSGFETVTLRHDKKKKDCRVHSLVAKAYLDNPHNYQRRVEHIDGDITNNRDNNLRWKGVTDLDKIIDIDGSPVPEFDTYLVTLKGKIYNKHKIQMSVFVEKKTGIQMVTLQQNGKKKDHRVHRVVAEVYLDNPNSYKFIRHINGDIQNNSSDNLLWVKTLAETKTGNIYILPEDREFKEIPLYPGYFITNDGKVYSLKTGEYLTLGNRSGYNCVTLSRNSKSKQLFVHKLVAQTYLTKKDEDVCVNHKNGIKKDNRVENLEWCTKSHDVKHALSTGLNPGRSRAVVQIRVKYKTKEKETYPSLSKASKATGISAGAICTSCKERTLIGAGRKTTKSGKVYKFRYRDSDYTDGRPREIVAREMKPKEKIIQTFKSIEKASQKTGVDPGSITNCCKGRMKFACSEDGTQYIWRYESPDTDTDVDNDDWKEIPGFTKYKVSTNGEVYSSYYKRVLDKQDKGDYETISLVNDDGDRHAMKVHRLVALAFHENENKKRVDAR